ncbi:MAG: hypothetical protein FRX48_09647 [Lasallia pustulata]|uniref:F-box domain-containing protein n=1 Tax=Lasallia pustulata TaxID=136370 RepID=A0A5M8PCU3_9LECA|nr:MAG: hypothetical protein FRX48_09647 [Lasallia pustulata]
MSFKEDLLRDMNIPQHAEVKLEHTSNSLYSQSTDTTMSKPSLLSLPDELQVEILNSLPYPDAQNLAAVDKYHRTLINLNAIRDKAHSANLLHQLHTAK